MKAVYRFVVLQLFLVSVYTVGWYPKPDGNFDAYNCYKTLKAGESSMFYQGFIREGSLNGYSMCGPFAYIWVA